MSRYFLVKFVYNTGRVSKRSKRVMLNLLMQNFEKKMMSLEILTKDEFFFRDTFDDLRHVFNQACDTKLRREEEGKEGGGCQDISL